MGKLDNFVKCFRFCRSHCNGQFLFRIATLFVLILGTVLQGIAISPKTAWDKYETVLHYQYVTQPVEISAYQTLYDVVLLKTVPKGLSSRLPPIYPKEKKKLNVGWKEIVVTYETCSLGLAAVCILIFENALLIHFLIPNSHFSRFFQPIVLIIVILASLGAGILAIFSALEYEKNYQKILTLNNKDEATPLAKSIFKAMESIHFNYNIEDNVLSTGYTLAIASGALFILTSALTIAILVIYFIGRFCKSQTSPVEDISDVPKKDLSETETTKDEKIKTKLMNGENVVNETKRSKTKDNSVKNN